MGRVGCPFEAPRKRKQWPQGHEQLERDERFKSLSMIHAGTLMQVQILLRAPISRVTNRDGEKSGRNAARCRLGSSPGRHQIY
jgi:hypothetical protein